MGNAANEANYDSHALVATGSQVTSLTVTGVQGNSVNVAYTTLPGNQPNTFGNYLAIWQSSNPGVVPWTTKALGTQIVPTNTQQGTATFEDLQIGVLPYIVGYAVGPEKAAGATQYGNVCSTASIPESGTDYSYFQTNLSNLQLGSTSLQITFTTPVGYTPEANKNWIALWEGTVAYYQPTPIPPQASTAISGNSNFGQVALNNINLLRGRSYILAYFMDGWDGAGSPENNQTAMACTYQFSV